MGLKYSTSSEANKNHLQTPPGSSNTAENAPWWKHLGPERLRVFLDHVLPWNPSLICFKSTIYMCLLQASSLHPVEALWLLVKSDWITMFVSKSLQQAAAHLNHSRTTRAKSGWEWIQRAPCAARTQHPLMYPLPWLTVFKTRNVPLYWLFQIYWSMSRRFASYSPL